MRLIDADKIMWRMGIDTSDKQIFFVTSKDIDEQPTIESTPVVHGRWIGPTRVDANNNKYECSECGFWGVPGWAACPKCTAKMDGGVCDG